MDREGQKGTTLIITSVRMPMYLGLGGDQAGMGCLSRVGSQSCQLFSLFRSALYLAVSCYPSFFLRTPPSPYLWTCPWAHEDQFL